MFSLHKSHEPKHTCVIEKPRRKKKKKQKPFEVPPEHCSTHLFLHRTPAQPKHFWNDIR